jgi:hypothetical protein
MLDDLYVLEKVRKLERELEARRNRRTLVVASIPPRALFPSRLAQEALRCAGDAIARAAAAAMSSRVVTGVEAAPATGHHGLGAVPGDGGAS